MLPIGLLMIEHRLIERMIARMDRELDVMAASGAADVRFIDTAVDFIRTYADRCHHGKEEDILFRDLGARELSPEHRRVMAELVAEHVRGRETVAALVKAREAWSAGVAGALEKVSGNMRALVEFYPRHIEKEDKHFFIPVMGYFTPAEKAAMLDECHRFDREMIHAHYRDVIERLEAPVP
ncbi:MAG: hemerythrin domain-containing protein [bacterium]